MSALQCWTTGKNLMQSPKNEKRKNSSLALCLLLCGAGKCFICVTLLPVVWKRVLRYCSMEMMPGSEWSLVTSHIKTRVSLSYKISENTDKTPLSVRFLDETPVLGWESGQFCVLLQIFC